MKDNKLYKGYFFIDILIFKTSINTVDISTVTILKFKSRQKMAFFSAARPDLASEFNSFEINLLNRKHTKKHAIFRLKNEESAVKGLNFITDNLNIVYKIYCPDFD